MIAPNVHHNGAVPPSAFTRGMFVFDPAQSLAEADKVRAHLEATLALVDPEDGHWCAQEAQKRACGERN